MQRRNSFSLYALLIAVLMHLLVVLLLAFIEKVTPTPPQNKEKKEESRFKVSLKEQPKIPKEALVKNEVPKLSKVRPIPQGEQLKTPTPITPQKPHVEPKPLQTPPQQPTPYTPSEPKKAFENHTAKAVATIDHVPMPKKEKGLYDILSQADPDAKSSTQSTIRVNDSIQKLYGDKFSELSAGEQKYILDNQETMRRITQGVLDRYGRSRIPDNLRVDETNTIEFYLHPDGSISGIRYLKNSNFSILDDTTKETIELAYSKYPRPAQTTYIRYRVWYNLN
jgi:outer membrane biosynthesis protein TonB